MKHVAYLYDSNGVEQFTFDVSFGFRSKRYLSVILAGEPSIGTVFSVLHRNGKKQSYEVKSVSHCAKGAVARAFAQSLVFEDA